MYSIKNEDDLENLEALASLKTQLEDLRLQDELGKQNFHEDERKVFEPVTKSIEDVSWEATKTMMETSIKDNKALEDLNDKLLEILNVRGTIAPYLLSPLSKISNPENTTQFKLVKDPSSNRVNDL